MGDDADDILHSFGLSNEERSLSNEESLIYGVIKEKFECHFIKRRSIMHERAKFNMRFQEKGEPACRCFHN